jgi:hypothetical protein
MASAVADAIATAIAVTAVAAFPGGMSLPALAVSAVFGVVAAAITHPGDRRTADRRRLPASRCPCAPSMPGFSGSGIPHRRRSPRRHSRRRRRTAVRRWWLPHRSCCYHSRYASFREGAQPDSQMLVPFPGPVQSSLGDAGPFSHRHACLGGHWTGSVDHPVLMACSTFSLV